ncbi:MAG: ABC transporter ATP-binding protein [Actinomycetota bacterium]
MGESPAPVNARLVNVTKQFAEVRAVDNLSLDIRAGEFLSLLGPSGCGKTTTLRMLGGFEEPSTGSIFFGEKDVTGLPPYRRDVNTVFQSYALFPHLSVGDNIAFGLRRQGVSKADAAQRVGEMLELVDLAGLSARRPAALSGGQQQRVALARALVNRPTLLLLDEPMSALDAKLRKHMQIELKRIQSQVGITFLYVTHDQEEALTMSDRIVVMNQGRIEGLGTPREVYERPQTDFVASFLGASNLLPGILGSATQGYYDVEVTGGHRLRVAAANVAEGLTASSAVQVGVRPEKIHLVPSARAEEAGTNCLRGVVRVATFSGVGNQYLILSPDGRDFTVYAQNIGDALAPRTGDEVEMRWPVEHTFVVRPSGTMTNEGE